MSEKEEDNSLRIKSNFNQDIDDSLIDHHFAQFQSNITPFKFTNEDQILL
jgi:hypothetical protein